MTTDSPSSAAQVRAELLRALALDLVGPGPQHPLESEQLPQPPSRWYLTGFLVPFEASDDQKVDPTSNEEIAVASDGSGGDDEATPEAASARRARFPSSIGISVLLAARTTRITATVTWGDYRQVNSTDSDPPPSTSGTERPSREVWQRAQRSEQVILDLSRSRVEVDVPNTGLRLLASQRTVPSRVVELVPKGTRAVSVFLVNHRQPAPDAERDQAFVFQATLTLESDDGFVARPNLRGRDTQDWDELVADIQYRNSYEFAVGHGVSTHAQLSDDGHCSRVESCWIPSAQVEKVIPGDTPEGLTLDMEALGRIDSLDDARQQLMPLVDAYTAWIEGQQQVSFDHDGRADIAREMLRRASMVRDRIRSGIELVSADQVALDAFRIANRAMAAAARRRVGDHAGTGPAPQWRPFQLAFVLMNLRAITDPLHTDRELVDLLFFPTGGGKTEAYLGLAAYTLVLRRLQNPGIASAGVSVLMRYTLRLLTLDQLGRAAALICALELERDNDVTKLGTWPFEIGLWVGLGATPNRIGRKGDNDRYSARTRTIAFQNDDKKSSPIPLENCPWCGVKFTRNAFTLTAGGRVNNDHPTDLRVTCTNRHCAFKGDRPLPIVAIDEPLYRRLPCFIIATVDKFAALPWVGLTGGLFGKVDRCDADGFYGPCEPTRGRPLDRLLLPPDLIIQDELHLISGPLGTMVGLYETAIDELCTRREDGRTIRPKVVASTATVRRADKQIQALFARHDVEVFPPPGPDVRDSYFARTVPAADPDAPENGARNARLYVGVAAQGRSLKVVLLRTYLALMSAAQKTYDAHGGARNRDNPADPYMTLVGYFNSLRELGGSRRIVEDEVSSRLQGYQKRRRLNEVSGPFASRKIAYEVVELTSRESTAKVADTKRRLTLPFYEKERVDVALATNMISVGLDITRLGLMVVLGQPKTTAEYIQATSRVGRDDALPGLVVTLLNVHRPRDRSHYERFEAFHDSFYRAVEATSVTPFAPRAVDRGLAAIAVALARLGMRELTAPSRAVDIGQVISSLGYVGKTLADRYAVHDPDLAPADVEARKAVLLARVQDVLDDWAKLAHEQEKVGAGLQYQREEGGAPPLLYEPLDPELKNKPAWVRKFKAQRSLRDVEPSVNLWVRTLDGIEIEQEEAQ